MTSSAQETKVYLGADPRLKLADVVLLVFPIFEMLRGDEHASYTIARTRTRTRTRARARELGDAVMRYVCVKPANLRLRSAVLLLDAIDRCSARIFRLPSLAISRAVLPSAYVAARGAG